MRRRAAVFEQPMVSAEFGYSGLGATLAVGVALVLAGALYAFVQWPVETAGWLGAAAVLRVLGRHPIAALFR